MQAPSQTFSIELQGNTYETKITQGKIIDFELNKVSFSKGFYNSIQDAQVLDIIDCISALYAFFPQIKKDTKIDIWELSPVETKEIIEVMSPFAEWYVQWKEFMSNPKKEEALEEENEDS